LSWLRNGVVDGKPAYAKTSSLPSALGTSYLCSLCYVLESESRPKLDIGIGRRTLLCSVLGGKWHGPTTDWLKEQCRLGRRIGARIIEGMRGRELRTNEVQIRSGTKEEASSRSGFTPCMNVGAAKRKHVKLRRYTHHTLHTTLPNTPDQI